MICKWCPGGTYRLQPTNSLAGKKVTRKISSAEDTIECKAVLTAGFIQKKRDPDHLAPGIDQKTIKE